MCHSESCIPSETGSGVVVYSIKTVVCKVGRTKLLKEICQEEHITLQVDVVVVYHLLTFQGSPHLICMCILRVRARTARQLAEECILRRQSRFIKSDEAIHVLIGIDPFPFYELKFVSDEEGLTRVFELINFEGLHETVQALRSELERVDELESVHSDGQIPLHVL